MERLKLTDPNWMFWRVLRQDEAEVASGAETSQNRLSRHPLNLLQGLALGYKGVYNVKPDGWHKVTEEPIYFNAPQPPGFYYSRWEKVKKPE